MAAPNKEGSDGPLATFGGARDCVRRLKSQGPLAGPVKVLFREGTYCLSAPVELTPEDSGTADAPITYAAYRDEKAVISGGRVITGWKREGNVWVADVPELRDDKWNFSALWVNGERRSVARLPQSGYYRAAGTVEDTSRPDQKSNVAFRFFEGDIQHWRNINDVRVVVTHAWEISTHYIASVDDVNHTVTFTGPAVWSFACWVSSVPYCVENVFEGLDAPGEWYLDRKRGAVYYWPMKGEDMAKTEVIAPVASQLLLLNGDSDAGNYIEFVNFEGLAFAYTNHVFPPEGHSDPQAAYGIRATVEASGARYCAFTGCEVAHTCNHAIWLADGCSRDRLEQNNLHDLGAGGVRIGGIGANGKPIVPSDWNEVDNNWIHGGGRLFPAGCGVWIGSCAYNTVSHNDISDFYYTGVSVGWSWGYQPSDAHHNTIEYNHIHRIGQGRLSDMGGIYMLGVSPGTIVRNNLIHDVWSMAYGAWGIYLDEGSTDILIENNVVYDTKTGGFHQHYGKENRIRNNVFAFAKEEQIIRTRQEEHLSFYFENNIVLTDNGAFLGGHFDEGKVSFEDNCYWNTCGDKADFARQTQQQWNDKGQDLRAIIADPRFVDPARGDFRLRPDSPVFALGIKPIDVRTAGLYGPKAWVRAAEKESRRMPPYSREEL
jgi:parallel beta-helix repeat protein